MTHDTHAVIEGTFVNYKRYPRQGCTHLLIEIPIEYTNKYVSILGEPTAAYPISVAVAALSEIPNTNIPVSSGVGGGGLGTVSSVSAATTADFDEEFPDYRV